MPVRKRQHYVPRFYLKHFSNKLNGKSIGVFNIQREKVIIAGSLKEQAYGDYFYGKDGLLEEGLGKIEASASSVISSIINHEKYPNKLSEDYVILLIFIIFLHGRTKHAADEENEMMDKFMKILFSKDSRFKDHLDDLNIAFKNAPQICLEIAAMSLPITLDLNYKILHNQTKVGFLTSDNPVVLYNQFLEGKKTFGSNIGLAAKGLQIFIPLSPKYLITLYDPDVYLVGNEKDLIIDIPKGSAINQLNYLQLLNSNENVYFNETVPPEYIINTFAKIKQYRSNSKAFVHEYPQEKGADGRIRSLVISHKHDIRFNFNISYIRIIHKAKQYELGNRAVHIRNEELCDIHREFMDAVSHGEYAPHQFKLFIEDRQRSKHGFRLN